jgi:phosphate transport system protein
VKAQARASLDRELRTIEDSVLRLGDLLAAAIERSIVALQEQDLGLAHQVAADDAQLNALRFEIEEGCLALIATQQPAAGDLRAVVAAMNIVSDLERMGDHAAGIARTVLRIGLNSDLLPPAEIERMARGCQSMLEGALEAFVARDAARARRIAAQDDEIDALYTRLFRKVLSSMIAEPGKSTQALHLLFIGHNLERIGDRVTNIAERAVFITGGEMRELNPEPYEASDLE